MRTRIRPPIQAAIGGTSHQGNLYTRQGEQHMKLGEPALYVWKQEETVAPGALGREVQLVFQRFSGQPGIERLKQRVDGERTTAAEDEG